MTSYREVWDKMNELSLCESSFDELKVLVSTCLDSFENEYSGRNETRDLLNITYKYLNFIADEYHQKFLEAFQTTIHAGKELDEARAKISRILNVENPQYTDEEMEAMTNNMTIKELLS